MHYEEGLGIITAGCYELPQFRLLAFLWGAHPNERNVVAYGEEQSRDLEKIVVLSDAISELPPVANDEKREKMAYEAPGTLSSKSISERLNVLDRFIPNRSAMDFDFAHYMLTEGKKCKENPVSSSPTREAYRKQLTGTFNMNRTQILAFKNKPPTPVEAIPSESSSLAHTSNPSNPVGTFPSSERTLDAPEILDGFYLNLLDWGSSDVLSIALGTGSTVYLWDASDGGTSELVTIDEESGPGTSVK
ncbi:hypothetical protein CASFOL_003439 [Castilleja foliolosa]|uniref:Uncharacterized protein n=1 Tax=Castilleja foliolosa TaxID=1961234 RepID=A0ABD3EH61_9LAMI